MTDETVRALMDTDPKELSYEQARDGLALVVTRLEDGSASLEESLALWERGQALARRCGEWLDSAQARLDAAAAVTPTTPAAGDPTAEEEPPDLPF